LPLTGLFKGLEGSLQSFDGLGEESLFGERSGFSDFTLGDLFATFLLSLLDLVLLGETLLSTSFGSSRLFLLLDSSFFEEQPSLSGLNPLKDHFTGASLQSFDSFLSGEICFGSELFLLIDAFLLL